MDQKYIFKSKLDYPLLLDIFLHKILLLINPKKQLKSIFPSFLINISSTKWSKCVHNLNPSLHNRANI